MEKIISRIRVKWVFFIFVFILVVGTLFVATKTPYNFSFDPLPQKIHAIKLGNHITFSGENVPVEYFDVAERLDRELLLNTYQHSSTILNLKLCRRFFPTIEQIFREEGVPDDLKYLAIAESSLRNAVSSSGAKGFWQFRELAASEFGLEVTDLIDERNHFEKSTLAAAKYLTKLNSRFGSWTLAAAAYNMGPTALQSAMNEQKENNYYDLNLSEETNRYVFRILAIKEIMKDPERFGYFLTEDDLYEPLNKYEIVEVDSALNSLADFAHQNNITYRQLKLYNPWLLKSNLPVKPGRIYKISIPK